MLNTAAIADLLRMSEEGVRLKRKRHEILGLEFAKRGIRYPAWQVLEGRQLLPALPRLFALLGDHPWRLFRFLQQHHSEHSAARARLMSSGKAGSRACWPLRRTPPPAPLPDWWPAFPTRWRRAR